MKRFAKLLITLGALGVLAYAVYKAKGKATTETVESREKETVTLPYEPEPIATSEPIGVKPDVYIL